MRPKNELVRLEYTHPRLSSPKSIRILKLYPAESGSSEPLRGHLIEVSIDDVPEYEALSYAWGSTDRVEELQCGSKIIPITRNCFQALRRLRLTQKGRYLWIDSICIDQGHHQERNHQVGLMGEVYRQARIVIVWLGRGNESTAAAIDYLKDVAIKSESKLVGWLTLDVPLDRKIVKVIDRRSPVLKQLTSLFERTWFQRVWPVQEIALSRQCRLLCGASSINLADFMGALDCLRNVTFTSDAIDQVHFHREMWTAVNGQQDLTKRARTVATCSKILLRSRFQNALEPRDKIFAFHGLFLKLGVELAHPDYEKAVARVYTEAVAVAIISDQSLEILSGVTGELSYGCPSWVTDFSNSSPICEVTIWSKHDAAFSSKPVYRIDYKEGLLTLRGALIDTVRGVSFVFPSAMDQPSTREEVSTLRLWLRELEEYMNDKTVIKFFEGLCRPSWSRVSHNTDLPPIKEWLGAIEKFNAKRFTTIDEWLAYWGNMHDVDERRVKTATMGDVLQSGLQLLDIKAPKGTGPLRMHQLLRKLLDRKLLFRTVTGYLGVASKMVRKGDNIGLFAGCNVPMVVRRKNYSWELVAPAYVYGIMDGSQWPGKSRLKDFTFS